MSATDYSVGLTVRIAIPLKLNPEFAIARSRHAGPAYDAAHHARLIQFHSRIIKRELMNPKPSADVRFD